MSKPSTSPVDQPPRRPPNSDPLSRALDDGLVHFSIVNGRAHITDDDLQRIKSQCR